jgi:hypothetical protein
MFHSRIPRGVAVASNDCRSRIPYKWLNNRVLVCHVERNWTRSGLLQTRLRLAVAVLVLELPFYIETTTLSVILVTLHSRSWTGLDWTDCKRLNSVAAYVACIKINIRTPEWQE